MGKASASDHYGILRMFHYEDAERRCYINPDEKPRRRGTAKVRFGVPPEEIPWAGLRPEQRQYFSRHVPKIAVRFKRDA